MSTTAPLEKMSRLGKLFNWVKTAVMGILGMCGGAVLMYVSPLVERVVKPPKPLANFAVEVDGSQVTFVNRAVGQEGWWDFGDGSALEPFAPDQKTLTHEYRKPGDYTAKLLLSNLVGEESSRDVLVRVDGAGTSKVPSIDTFLVEPIDPQRYAPATFKLTTKIANADLSVWACGGEHPLEVVTDPPAAAERYVTFTKPGQYTIKLAAVQGKQLVERSAVVQVLEAPFPSALAMVKVQTQAVRIKTSERQVNVKVDFPRNSKDSVYRFSREIAAEKGKQIIAAKFAKPEALPYLQNVKLDPVAGGSKALLTGEYLPARADFNKKGANPSWVPQILLTQEQKSEVVNQTGDPVMTRLNVPGSTMIPLPKPSAEWNVEKRQVQLELQDGSRVVWNGPGLPKNAFLMIQNRPYHVTATDQGHSLRVDLQPAIQGGLSLGNK